MGKWYGSVNARGTAHQRNLFVIAPDGTISYRVIGFNVLSADAYTELEKAVDKAAGVATP